MALGAFSRGATEPLSPAAFGEMVPDPLGVVPEAASIISTDPDPPPLPYLGGEGDVFTEEGFEAEPAETPPVAIDEELPDAWAEAFASGSRVPQQPLPYPVVVTPEVQRFLDLFTGKRREIVSLWVSRSSQYLGMVRDVFRARGLPEELAYTAMIESGFKPDAVSRMGAKGMWQFMAPTARRYGLRVDSWVDERFDPEKSTVAAAAYLSDLYKQFGSWALAKAAYNAGEMKVARAIEKTGSSDFWTLAESKYLRRETKEFVPQIHAVTVISREPERYGFEFEEVEPAPVETVAVPPRTDLRRLAGRIGVPFTTLRSLNRVLVRGVTPPDRPWQLRVPLGATDTVRTALAPRRPAPKVRVAATRDRSAEVVAAGVHVVRPRDTVSSIAKRYGVSVRDVLRWNRLESQARIRPGDRLRVATRPAVEPDGQGGFR